MTDTFGSMPLTGSRKGTRTRTGKDANAFQTVPDGFRWIQTGWTPHAETYLHVESPIFSVDFKQHPNK